MLVTDLGVYDNADQLSSTIDTLQNLLHTNIGIDVNPTVNAYDDIWMSKTDYENIESDRETVKGTVVNYITENNKLTQQLLRANARIAALEELVSQMSS